MTESTTAHGVIKVDVWSDVACPWCFIGKRKFETAVAAFQGGATADDPRVVEVEFHSFELSPDTPVEFEGTAAEFLATHKGMTPEQVAPMLQQVTDIAAAVGLHYDYDRLQHTNTLLAHQLLHLAKSHGLQGAMKERLLQAYFEQGRHLGHIEVLADLAVDVGLDRAEVVDALSADRYLDDVRADQALASEYGITGVPFFVIDGRYGISGAQDPELFVQGLTQAFESRTPARQVLA